MLVRALKTFRGRYGNIKAGETFNAEPGYVVALNRNKRNPLVEVISGQAEPGPANDRNKGDAPGRAGKVNPGDQGRAPASGTEPTQDGGTVLTSQSLPAVPASRKKTAVQSARGGRRGKPTARKSRQKATAKTPSTPAAPPGA